MEDRTVSKVQTRDVRQASHLSLSIRLGRRRLEARPPVATGSPLCSEVSLFAFSHKNTLRLNISSYLTLHKLHQILASYSMCGFNLFL